MSCTARAVFHDPANYQRTSANPQTAIQLHADQVCDAFRAHLSILNCHSGSVALFGGDDKSLTNIGLVYLWFAVLRSRITYYRESLGSTIEGWLALTHIADHVSALSTQ